MKKILRILLSGLLILSHSPFRVQAWSLDPFENEPKYQNQATNLDRVQQEGSSGKMSSEDIRSGVIQSTVKSVLTQENLNTDGVKIDVQDGGHKVTVTLGGDSSASPELSKKIVSSIREKGLGTVSVSFEKADQSQTEATSHDRTTPQNNRGILPQKSMESAVHTLSPKEQAREIIISHFKQIEKTGKMRNDILYDGYWKEVFAAAGKPELLKVAMPDIAKALDAGIKPYNENGSLAEFPKLALEALGATDASSVQKPPSSVIPETPGQTQATSKLPESAAAQIPKEMGHQSVLATGREPVPTSQLPENVKATALQFAKTDMASFSKASYNRKGFQAASEDLIKAAPVFKSPSFTKAIHELTNLSQNPVKNSQAILNLSDTLNQTLHDHGLHLIISVNAADTGDIQRGISPAPQGRVDIITYEITKKSTVDIKGQRVSIFELRNGDGLNFDLALAGHQEEGNRYAFSNGGVLDDKAERLQSLQAGKTNLSLTIPTKSGLKPNPEIPQEFSHIPAVLDGIITKSMGTPTPSSLRQKTEDSTNQHEGFHVYFFMNGGEISVKMLEGAHMIRPIQEQGAYIHQLAATAPELTKIVLSEMFNKSLGSSGGATGMGTTQALFSLQQHLEVKFFKQDQYGRFINVIDISQLPKIFNLKSETIQAAATSAENDFLKRYLPQIR